MQGIMPIQAIRDKLADAHLPDIQRSTGLAYNTLKNVRDGKSVMYHTLVVLSNYFQPVE